MIAGVMHLLVLFLPLFAAVFALYEGLQYGDRRGRVWFWPYFALTLKELLPYLLMRRYGVAAFRALYRPEAGVPEWVPGLLWAWDLVALAVWAFFVLEWLEYPLWLRAAGLVLSAGAAAAALVTGWGWVARWLLGVALSLFVVALQKTSFECGTNFVVETKGSLGWAVLFLAPGLLYSGFQTGGLGHLFRLGFHAFAVVPVFALAWWYYRRDQEEKALVEREKETVERLLNRVGSAIASNQDRASILEMVVEFALEATQARAGAIILWNKRRTHLSVEVVVGPYPPLRPVDGFVASKEKFLVEKFRSEPVLPDDPSYVGRVVRSGEPLLIANALEDPSVVQSARGIIDITTVMCFPLTVGEELLGVLSVINKATDDAFNQDDFRIGQAVAEQAAVALNTINLRNEYHEKLESEKQLAVAAQIQQELLPTSFPETDRLEIGALSRAAKGVSGDYYDLVPFEDRLAVVMADVAGKGVPAALVMVMIRSALRTIVRSEADPREVVSAINRAIAGEVSQERYATLFLAMIDIHTGFLRYTNAGHGPMLVYRAATDTFELLDTAGLPVGITRESEYGQDDTVLNAGDIAVLYTDGITEAMNLRHEEYTLARVKEDIKRHRHRSAREIAEAILARVAEFTGDAPQHDDETILVVRMKPEDERRVADHGDPRA